MGWGGFYKRLSGKEHYFGEAASSTPPPPLGSYVRPACCKIKDAAEREWEEKTGHCHDMCDASTPIPLPRPHLANYCGQIILLLGGGIEIIFTFSSISYS